MTPDQHEGFAGREVRLFPSVRISSEREAELRATASLLAILRSVSEFGRKIVHEAGGPAGSLSCFTEVSFQLRRANRPPEEVRPDGVVRVVRGKTSWTALVETKVSGNDLIQDQVDRYHRLAGQEGFDCVITVSNQAALTNGRPPVNLDGRRLRAAEVRHFSWDRLLSEAQVLSRKKRVSDPDQKWMLDEWIRYVDDPNSKIMVPPDFGKHWTEVLKAARTDSLRSSPELRSVSSHWVAYLSKAALKLRAKLGVDVRPRVSRAGRTDPSVEVDHVLAEASSRGVLAGALVVPDAAGDLSIELFMQSKTVQYGIELNAPTEGRQLTRLRWLARQLNRFQDIPTDLQVTIIFNKRGVIACGSVVDFVEDPASLLTDAQGIPFGKDIMPRRFVLELSRGLRTRRSTTRVLSGVTSGLEDFYRRVIEGLTPYVPPTPRLPKEPRPEPPPESLTGPSRQQRESATETSKSGSQGFVREDMTPVRDEGFR